MKLEKCNDTQVEAVVNLLNATELGALYFNNDLSRIRGAVVREHAVGHVMVAVNDNNELVGTLIHDDQGTFGKYPYIHMIAVAPGFQSKGYGRAMLDSYEKSFEKEDMKFFLLVAQENLRAKKLYEALGYCEVGSVNGFYVKGQTEVIMMKSREI